MAQTLKINACLSRVPGGAEAPIPKSSLCHTSIRGLWRHWDVCDLATIGIFSALTRVTSLAVALVGGGMNPLTLILKNLIFTALLVVLLFKVRKPGSLLLFVSINALFSMLLMGGEFMLLPAMLLGGVIAEGLMAALGGYRSAVCLMVGVALYDLFYKSASLTLSWLFMREQPQIVWMASIIVAIGYLGAIAGLFVGLRFVKELRHAGIIRV